MLIGTRPTFSKLGIKVVVWEDKRSCVLFFFFFSCHRYEREKNIWEKISGKIIRFLVKMPAEYVDRFNMQNQIIVQSG